MPDETEHRGGECILLFTRGDIMVQKFLIDVSSTDEEQKKNDTALMNRMVDYCETSSCYGVRFWNISVKQ